MHEHFKNYIEHRHLLALHDRILLAVSGGVDSMVMLELFRNYWPAEQLAVAHCNFSLRGTESDGDEVLVREVCWQAGIAFHATRFNTSAEAAAHGESIQMAARRLRYGWFAELCTEQGYTRVATAHQADDAVETFFINLMRGTGLRGLTGIGQLRGRIVRPLLWAERDKIIAFAAAEGVAFRNDSSNDSLHYLRNRLRHEILPLFSSSSQRFTTTMEGNLARLQQTQEFIDLQIEALRREAVVVREDGRIEILWTALPVESLAFVLHELLYPYGFTSEAVEELATLLTSPEKATRSGKRFQALAWEAVVDRERLLLAPHAIEPFIEEWIAEDDPRLKWMTTEELPQDAAGWNILKPPPQVAYLAADALRFPLCLRRWREGDWFIPLGMAGQKKVSDFLIDAKVPLPEKGWQGVLLSGETIVWLVGRRIDDRYRVRPSTRRVVRICF